MAIVNTEVPITSELTERYLRQIAERYPFVRLEEVGDTDFERPVWMLTIGTGRRKVLFTAAHHANEWITALVLLKYAEDLAEAIRKDGILFGQRAKDLAEAVTIYLIPLVNPDGVDLVTGAIPAGAPSMPWRKIWRRTIPPFRSRMAGKPICWVRT